MSKKFTSLTFALVLMLALLTASFSPALAQAPVEDGTITLAQLEGAEIFLDGPYASSTLFFGLPADWAFSGDAQLDLSLTTSFSVASTGDIPVTYGGLLTIRFNRYTVAILPLNNIGTLETSVTIPAAYLPSVRPDGRMELRFTLDSGISCQANQHMNVVINQGTRLSFPFEKVQPNTDLINFPRPIFQNTIYPDFALIVVPDNPSSAEMQAALSVSAGLGNLTSSNLGLDLTTAGQLTAEQQASDHLIFIGKAGSIPQFTELPLPLPTQNGEFSQPNSSPDDGVVQMVNSPWSVSKMALVISGNTDEGVLKAAQAVSSGSLQSNSTANLSIVETVQELPTNSPMIADQTFADLGYEIDMLQNRGISSAGYNFYVPAGSTASEDAFFELAFGHSALVDFNLSGIVVLLNDQPIGSIRFTADTAAEAINKVQFSLPQTLILPGNNRIDVRASLEPLDDCSDPNLEGLFAVIWPESRLYLPFTSAQMRTTSNLDLSIYPAPLSFDTTLGSLAFVLQRGDLNAWKSAVQIAKYLGDRSNGPISMPAAFLDGDASTEQLANYNLIVVGKPSQMAIMDELNPALPVPFDTGSDQAKNTYSQVVYRIPADVSLGYVELLTSPWNSDRMVIAALGNTDDGITWASSALANSPLRGQLAGNFAVINRTQIQTVDTRIGQPVESITEPPIEVPVVQPPSEPLELTPPPANQEAWILPTLAGSGGLILVILIVALIANARGRKS